MIKRSVFHWQNGFKSEKLNFQDYVNNEKLEENQILNINYLPIIIMKNKPNENSDCALVGDKIKMLDVFFEQIIVDVLVNSPKFIFENIYGNTQEQVEDALRKLLLKNYLFTHNNTPVDVLQGQYRVKA